MNAVPRSAAGTVKRRLNGWVRSATSSMGLRPKCLRDEFRITVFSMPANLSGDDLINQAVRVVILLAGLCNSPGDAPLDNNIVIFSNNIVYLEFAQAL